MAEKRTQTFRPALFFFVVLACYGLFLHPLPGDNVNSRLDLAAAMVNEGTIRIDAHHENTIDKARVGGHYYSDKAPGTSWWALPVAYAARRWVAVDPENIQFRHLMSLLIVSIPAALAATFLALLLQRLGGGAGASFTIAAFYALGTLNFPYSTMFYSHALTGSISFIVFAIIFIHRKGGRTMGPCAAMLCGLLAGAMTAGEYPAALTAVLLFVYSLFAVRKRWHAGFFILGMVPFAAAVLAYNNAAFGNPFTTGYVRESLPVFNEGMDRGFAGITFPSLATIYKILLSPGRGFLWQSPFLLFAVPGWLGMRRGGYRLESWIVLAIALEVIAVGVSAYMPEGGMAVGPRYLIPALPFLCIPLVFLSFEKAWLRRIFLGLGVASIVLMFIATATDPQVPRGFDATIVEFNLPLFLMPYLRPLYMLFNQIGTGDISYHALFPIVIAAMLASVSQAWLKEPNTANGKKNISHHFLFLKEITAALVTAAIFLGAFYALNIPSLSRNTAQKLCGMGSYFRSVSEAQSFGWKSVAESWYEKGIAAEGDAWECHFGMGKLLRESGEYKEAEKHYVELLRTGHELPQVYYNLGEIYFHEYRNHAEAFMLFEKSAELHVEAGDVESAVGVYHHMASLKNELGAVEDAEKLYRKAVNTAPDLPIAYGALYLFLAGRGRYEEAEEIIGEAMNRFPSVWELHLLHSYTLLKLDRKMEAFNEIEKAMREFSNNHHAREKFMELKREIESKTNP